MRDDIRKITIGQTLRDQRPKSATPARIVGLANLYAVTEHPAGRFIPLEAGINAIATVQAPGGRRRPAILICSSPHKAGSTITPWQDFFAPDEGYIRYYGDAKHPGEPASKARGNALLVGEFKRIIGSSGTSYRTHGVTRGSGDGGIDFIAQLDVGEGFSRTPMVVLGQAKCVAPGGQANAKDLARTVARLRRGWLGVFVTTGSISERGQAEVYEDRYPLLLIPGRRVAEVVRDMLLDAGYNDVRRLLASFDEQYELQPRVVDPERLVV